jgi:hypothetical protein
VSAQAVNSCNKEVGFSAFWIKGKNATKENKLFFESNRADSLIENVPVGEAFEGQVSFRLRGNTTGKLYDNATLTFTTMESKDGKPQIVLVKGDGCP